MSSLGQMNVRIHGFVAGNVNFIPGNDKVQNHSYFTIIANRGKNPNTQEEQRDEITVHAWGKLANVAALYCPIGKEIEIEGSLRSYRANDQSPTVHSVHANGITLLGDSSKLLDLRMKLNVLDAVRAGKIPPVSNSGLIDVSTLTVDNVMNSGLLVPVGFISTQGCMAARPVKNEEFNWEIAKKTGYYGIAKIQLKDPATGKTYYLCDQLGKAPAQPTVTTPINPEDVAKALLSNPALLAQVQAAFGAMAQKSAPPVEAAPVAEVVDQPVQAAVGEDAPF